MIFKEFSARANPDRFFYTRRGPMKFKDWKDWMAGEMIAQYFEATEKEITKLTVEARYELATMINDYMKKETDRTLKARYAKYLKFNSRFS